jgi:type I restriction enzyme S subunit
MVGEWPLIPLTELYEISSGLSKPRQEFGFGTPFVTFKDVLDNYFIPSPPSSLVNATEKERHACSVKRGDVFLTRTSETQGELGMSSVALEDFECATFNGFTKRLRPKAGTDLCPEYVGYCFRGQKFRQAVTAMSSLSTRASLNNEMIARLSILVPPIEIQTQIGRILKTLDDKIELNRQMNATLESMARALFQSWFVDFDPVRAKLDGRPPTGMDKATADLFPDSFQESPLGDIPKGWNIRTLGDIARNVSITFDFNRMQDVVFINTGDVMEGDFLHANRNPYFGLPGQAKKSIQKDDILFSEIRPANKRYAYVDFDSRDYVVSTKFMIIRGSREIHPRLLYRILTRKETLAEFQLQAESRSGTFPQITFDSINHLPIILPPTAIQEAFRHAVGCIDDQIKINKHQSRTLATLRDTLLPKLLSGKLSLADLNPAERKDAP